MANSGLCPESNQGAHNDPKPPVVLSDAQGVRNNARALLSYVMFAVVGKNPRSAPDACYKCYNKDAHNLLNATHSSVQCAKTNKFSVSLNELL